MVDAFEGVLRKEKAALLYLKENRRKECIAALLLVLDSGRVDRFHNAIWALGELAAMEALPILRRMDGDLIDEYRNEYSFAVRSACREAILKLEPHVLLPRTASATEALTEVLPKPASPADSSTDTVPRTLNS